MGFFNHSPLPQDRRTKVMKRSAGGIAPFQGCHPLGAAGCCLAFCSRCFAPVMDRHPYDSLCEGLAVAAELVELQRVLFLYLFFAVNVISSPQVTELSLVDDLLV